jgi:hypothetical protein
MKLSDTLGAPPPQYAFESVTSTDLRAMFWKGTLGQVCDEIEASRSHGVSVLEPQVWHPARIVRGVLESDIDGQDRVSLIVSATRFAVRAYAGVTEDTDIHTIKKDIVDAGLSGQQIIQGVDPPTARGTASQLSSETAARLDQKVDGPTLIIPVCHGGFLAGVQTALCRYRQGHEDTTVYPLRFSRYKSREKSVHIPPQELEHIQSLAEGRTVVLHDEDASNGAPLDELAQRMAYVLPEHTVLGAVNLDAREDYRSEDLGPWWEKSAEKGRKLALLDT